MSSSKKSDAGSKSMNIDEGEEEASYQSGSASSFLPTTLNESLIYDNLKAFQKHPGETCDNRSRHLFFRKVANAPFCLTAAREEAMKRRKAHEILTEKVERDLDELRRIGEELKTNLAMEEQKRELEKMATKKENRLRILMDYYKENKQHMARYEALRSQWTELDYGSGDAVKVFNQIEAFQADFMRLMENKDKLLERIEEQFEDLMAQIDVDSIYQNRILVGYAERINAQMDTQRRAYDIHLTMLEETLNGEFREYFEQQKENYQRSMEKTKKHDQKLQDLVDDKQEVFFNYIRVMQKEEAGLTHHIRVAMEQQYRTLETELFDCRLAAQKITEQLEYSYGLLLRKIPEDDIILNNLRRHVAKTNTNIMKLRTAMKNKKDRYALKIKKKKDFVEYLHRRLTDDEQQKRFVIKSLHKNFLKMWEMYHFDALSMLKKILVVDRTLTEDLLSLKWEEVDLNPIVQNQRFKKRKNKYKGRQSLFSRYGLSGKPVDRSQSIALELRFLRNILRLIPLKTEDMANKKLTALMKNFPHEVKDVVHIHYFLNLLQVSDLKEIKTLTRHFQPFADKVIDKKKTAFAKDADCPDELVLVKTHMLYTALTKYIEDRQSQKQAEIEKDQDCRVIFPREYEILDCWSDFYSILPNNIEKMWKIMKHCMLHFLKILKRRDYLLRTCEKLRVQNRDLRYLLKEYCGH